MLCHSFRNSFSKFTKEIWYWCTAQEWFSCKLWTKFGQLMTPLIRLCKMCLSSVDLESLTTLVFSIKEQHFSHQIIQNWNQMDNTSSQKDLFGRNVANFILGCFFWLGSKTSDSHHCMLFAVPHKHWNILLYK